MQTVRLEPKLMALVHDPEINIPQMAIPTVIKCCTCSNGDPFNDWYVWNDSEYIAQHSSLYGNHGVFVNVVPLPGSLISN